MKSIQIPTFDFTGKTVVITGSGSGIGQAAALEFAHYGANVVVADISAAAAGRPSSAILAHGGSALAVPVDVSKSSQVDALVQTAVGTLRRPGHLPVQQPKAWGARCSPSGAERGGSSTTSSRST